MRGSLLRLLPFLYLAKDRYGTTSLLIHVSGLQLDNWYICNVMRCWFDADAEVDFCFVFFLCFVVFSKRERNNLLAI